MSSELVLPENPTHAQLTMLLREASKLLNLKDYFRPPLSLYLRIHDAGCQAEISLQYPQKPRILVWAGSIWYNPQNNRDDKSRLGYNAAAEFAHDRIKQLLNQVYQDYKVEAIAAAGVAAREAAALREFYSGELDRKA